MAEAVGLALGAVALIGTFKDCIDLFSTFTAAKALGADYEILITKLDIQKALLLLWAEKVRLLEPSYDERLDHAVTGKAVSDCLGAIQILLGESENLQQLYGLTATNSHSTSISTTMSHGVMEKFVRDFERLKLRIEIRQKNISVKQRFIWAIKDKEKFSRLVEELSYFVSHLNALVPDQHCPPFAIGGHSDLHLTKLLNAADPLKDPEAEAEERRRNCRQRILDTLWYRKLDDRKLDIADAHRRTLQWALQPPSLDVEWDDLSDWLKSGFGLYWVSGKAGSGKSTLMKYLFYHQQTSALLKQWAGSRNLCQADFFFWHLGTVEQKTHEGLTRGLLYHVLSSEPFLIPHMLPRMWREAYLTENINPHLPSKAEMREAFATLRSANTNTKFCFFIDGLDEYDGQQTEAVRFINELASVDHIKVLVSSRPIPACFQAFSSKSMLKLQDLTYGDIREYVEDTLGSHPSTAELRTLYPSVIEKIIQEVVEKACGVFLWVVLACRSLLEGFAVYDSLAELQRRVDELPPELESLFQHILNKVEPRYRQAAAKTLRLRHQTQMDVDSQFNGPTEMSALGMALFDQQEFIVTQVPIFRLFSLVERQLIFRAYEARLRSICGGILELRPGKVNCFCRGAHADRKHYGVDYVVEFLHRTVFEFLNQPKVWDLNCLRINDNNFQPNAALGLMNLPLLHMSLTDDVEYPVPIQVDDLMLTCLTHAWRADRAQSTDLAVLLLRGFSKLILNHIRDQRNSPVEPSFWYNVQSSLDSQKCTLSSHDAEERLSLILAAELNISDTFMHLWKLRPPKDKDNLALLYHSIGTPLIFAIDLSAYFPLDSLLIEFLLNQGCDPNESIPLWRTTPWKCCLEMLRFVFTIEGPGSTSPHVAASRASLLAATELLVSSGANLTTAETFLESKLSSWIEANIVKSNSLTQIFAPNSIMDSISVQVRQLVDLVVSKEGEFARDMSDGDENDAGQAGLKGNDVAANRRRHKRSRASSTSSGGKTTHLGARSKRLKS